MIPPRKRKDGRGRNRPPKQYQFKPGESGNKKGRPKKAPTVLDFVEKELTSKHSINIAGQHVNVPMSILLVKQLMRLALKGNTKALFLSLEMLDTIQKVKARRYSDSLRPKFNRENLKNMSSDELTALYFEALKPLKSEDDDEGDHFSS